MYLKSCEFYDIYFRITSRRFVILKGKGIAANLEIL